MKKYLVILVMLVLLMNAGCQDKTPGTTEESPATEPEKEISILDNREILDDKGILSYISNSYIEDGIQQEIFNFQENLLISSSYYDEEKDSSVFTLELVSTQTGELMAETELDNVQVPAVQILERHIVVNDMVGGKTTILNSSLEKEKDYEFGEGTVFLNKKMTKAFCIDHKDGINVINLTDNTSKRWLTEAEDVYVSKICGDNVSLTYTEKKTGMSAYAFLNLAAEEIDVLDLDKSLYAVEHNSHVWLAGLVGESEEYLFGTEEVPQVIRLENGDAPSLVANTDDLIVIRTDNNNTLKMSAYRPDGTYMSGAVLLDGANGYWGNILWFESLHGYLLTCIDETGTDKLYHWDTTVQMEGEPLEFYELESEVQTGDSVSEHLYDMAATIGEKYGVTVKIADQCETEYGTYTVEQNLNEEKIERGLEILDISLSAYPDGFIDQLHFGYYRELEINLMGSIYAVNRVEENKNGFDSFIAFVQQQESRYVMIFDLNRGQLIEQDLYHEFSHLIDKKLQNIADQGKKILYSEEAWARLNPKNFDYAYSYTDVPSAFYYDGYDDYFVDIYSRTFPTEDRARIMEYAMTGAEFCFDTYPGLVTKLSYYCECIRDGFDTEGWPEVTKWEEILQKYQ